MSQRVAVLLDRPRLGRYLSVGAVGAVFDLTVSWTITLLTVLPPAWAKLVGAECAIVLMFFLNERWTFAAEGRPGVGHVLRRLLTSNLVRSGGLAVQFLVVWWLTRLDVSVFVAGIDVWPLLTMPVAILCGFVFNYVAESAFTWRVI